MAPCIAISTNFPGDPSGRPFFFRAAAGALAVPAGAGVAGPGARPPPGRLTAAPGVGEH